MAQVQAGLGGKHLPVIVDFVIEVVRRIDSEPSFKVLPRRWVVERTFGWMTRWRRLPLLMLTARGEPMDRIVGLEIGADDYLPKPFEPRELLARVKALLRRAAPEPAADDVLRFGRLEVDLGARQARLDGQPCDLTGHQFDLLVVLARSPGRVLTRDQIMDALKGHPLEAFDRSIDVHISRIRAVIEDDPKSPKRVLTVRGSGYVFARKQDASD